MKRIFGYCLNKFGFDATLLFVAALAFFCMSRAISAAPPAPSAAKSQPDRERAVKVALAVANAPAVAPMPREVHRVRKIDKLLESERQKKIDKVLHVSAETDACPCPGGKCTCPPGGCDCLGCECGVTGGCKAVTRDPYAAAYDEVARGKSVMLYVGVPLSGFGGYHVDTLRGFAPGIYRCAKNANGDHEMTLLVGYATPCANGRCNLTTPAFSTCPNGKCPNAR